MTNEEYIKATFIDGKCKFCDHAFKAHLCHWQKDGKEGYLLQCCDVCGCDGTERGLIVQGSIKPVDDKWVFEKV